MRRLIRAFASHLDILWLKLLTKHHLEYLSLKGGCTYSSESTLVKIPHCWKSHVWVYTCQNTTLLEITFCGSNITISYFQPNIRSPSSSCEVKPGTSCCVLRFHLEVWRWNLATCLVLTFLLFHSSCLLHPIVILFPATHDNCLLSHLLTYRYFLNWAHGWRSYFHESPKNEIHF